MRYLILVEKKSALDNFTKALGGRTGRFDNFDYEVKAMHGHLLTLDEPQNQMADETFKEHVSHWSDVTTVPWKLQLFDWKKAYIKSKNPRTKRMTTTKKDVDAIKAAANQVDAIVIATDNDPSGEGDVLGHELLDAIHWRKKTYRCRFKDESASSIKSALSQLEDVTDKAANTRLGRGLARERFDYATMQLSRLATRSVRDQSYDEVIRPGRLKSVIIELIYQQTRARDTFVAKDQFQAVFKDENGNKFVNPRLTKHPEEALAENDLSQLQTSTITIGSTKRQSSKAPKLLDFAQVGVVLGKVVHAPMKKVISTYQSMYQDGILSYPRTDDSAVTPEQWAQMLPLVDTIATIVGVDPALLTQRTARKPYVSTGELSHGANRPGLTVPNSMAELTSKYGEIGAKIYETLAKSYLATLAADYEYDHTQAFVTDYPKFTCSKNVMAKPGFKAILNGISDDDDDDKKAESNDKQFGQTATPKIDVSKTTAPKKPSRKFVVDFLKKNNVGTGATQLSTLADLSEGKRAVMKESRGSFKLTDTGYLSGAVMSGTMLASPAVTKQLTGLMHDVGDGKIPMENIYKAVNVVIDKDQQKMDDNASRLDKDSYLTDKLPKKSGNSQNKCHGTLPDGTEVAFKGIFMGHRFTEGEIADLLALKTISIPYSSHGQQKTGKGKLEHQSFVSKKDHKTIKYWGFKMSDWG